MKNIICYAKNITLIFYAISITGCAAISAVSAATTIAGAVMEVSGISKKESDIRKTTKQYKVAIFSGENLNTTKSGKSLSLVTKVYVLRSSDKLAQLTPDQLATEENEKNALGEDLISTREVTLLPGKSYEISLVVPGDAIAIGVVGMFRAPYANRWRIAFDLSNASPSESLTVGAHACAFNASKGPLIGDISPESIRSLVGVQCNS